MNTCENNCKECLDETACPNYKQPPPIKQDQILALYDANAARIQRLEKENKTMKNDILNLSNLITQLWDKIVVNTKEDKDVEQG